MLANRWRPFTEFQSEVNRLQGEMNRLFGRVGNRNGGAYAPTGYPPLNVWENEDDVVVEAELPGLELDDLEIYVNGGNQLSIKGERKQPSDEGGTWHRRERGFGTFARIVGLPNAVDADKVDASFKYGVLTIKMAKQEAAKPRRIAVKAQ